MIGAEINSINCTGNKIGKDIVHSRALTNKMVQQEHLSNHGSHVTPIFPLTENRNSTISGFDLFKRFKKYNPEKNSNFQQYLASNKGFVSYIEMSIHSNKNDFSIIPGRRK